MYANVTGAATCQSTIVSPLVRQFTYRAVGQAAAVSDSLQANAGVWDRPRKWAESQKDRAVWLVRRGAV